MLVFRRIALLAVTVAATLAGYWVFFGTRQSSETVATPLQILPGRTAAISPASCAGSNCHGGQLAGENDCGSRVAATVWLKHDRHSHAYDVLVGEKARQIMLELNPDPTIPPALAVEDARCLACHTNPRTVFEPGMGRVDLSAVARIERSYGVSCQVCHENPEKWLTSHTHLNVGADGKPLPPAEIKSAYDNIGMTWLNDIQERANRCVGCHVGAPDDKKLGIPRRDVTHDMIAAGHPRLAFEFSSYLKNMPHHWVERDRTQPQNVAPAKSASSVEIWLAGQSACAAALRLIEDAVVSSNWPEFARYDCYGCHHDLETRKRSELSFRSSAGKPILSSWSFSLPLRRFAGVPDELQKRFDELDSASSLERPGKKVIADTIADVVEFQKYRQNRDEQVSSLRKSLLDLLADEKLIEQLNWDDAAQIYLALVAWCDAADQPPPGFSKKLEEFADALRFQRSGNVAQNSPQGYSPKKVKEILKSSRSLLDGWRPAERGGDESRK